MSAAGLARAGVFFSLVIIHLVLAKAGSVWQMGCPYAPFVRVGIIIEISGRVVGDDIIEQVGLTGVDKLVCFSWRIQDTIARLDTTHDFAGADFAGARDNQVEFPFRRMAVKWKVLSSGWQTDQFNLERRLARKLWTGFGMFEGEGNIAQESVIVAFGGFPFTPRNVVHVHFFHNDDITRFFRPTRRAGHLLQRYIFGPDLKTLVLILPHNRGIKFQQLRRQLPSGARQQALGSFSSSFEGTVVVPSALALLIIPVGDCMDGAIFHRPVLQVAFGCSGQLFKRHQRLAAVLANQAGFPHVAREQRQYRRSAAR